FALLPLPLAAVIGSPAPAPANATSRPTPLLAGDVVHNLNLATLAGPVSAAQPVTVGVVLKNPNEAGETAYIKSLYDPSSSQYQQFLDPDQANTQFGVPAPTVQ